MTHPRSLESLERLGWRFGLETIRALLSELGDPHLSLKCAHVAGSNGKGSTCAFMASYLRQCGFQVGLYTSPHLSNIRERFRINGAWIDEIEFDNYSKKILKACEKVRKRLGHDPTHFEALTALAFLWFRDKKVEWAVVEVGLGGRLDATNVIENPDLSLITPIGLEHQEILGKKISKIAWEKAGILKEGIPAATIQYNSTALNAIRKVAKDRAVHLWVGGLDFLYTRQRNGFHWEGPGLSRLFTFPHRSDFQIMNASLAIAGIQILQQNGMKGKPEQIQRSMTGMKWPGRLEVLRKKPLILLDGAHNPDAARVLVSFLRKEYPRKKWIVLNGFLKDKDYETCAKILSPLTTLSLVTEPPSDRTEKGEKVFRAWERERVSSLLVRDWEKALAIGLIKSGVSSNPFPLLITGSLYLGGACRKRLIGYKGLERI